jgi:SAM-dependent methyltransferase
MEIYKIRRIRTIIVKFRAYFLVKIARRLKTLESKNAFGVTIEHNLKGLYHCNDRIKFLIDPVACIEKINRNSKFLIIGPRNEHDLYLLSSHGFPMKNIIGLDLISYSSKIHLGDMHAIPFDTDSFDVVIFGWTLSYSSTPQKAIDEIIRVVKSGGIVATGVEYSKLNKEDSEKLLGYSIQEYDLLNERINSSNQIIELFKDSVGHIYFNHNAPLKISHSSKSKSENVSNVAVILEINKNEKSR